MISAKSGVKINRNERISWITLYKWREYRLDYTLYLTTIGIRFFNKFFTVCTPLILSSLAIGENFPLASSERLMISSFNVLHIRNLPFSCITVNTSPTAIVLFRWLQRSVSRTITRRFGFRERSRTDSMQRVDLPSSLSSSKYPGYVSGKSILDPMGPDKNWNCFIMRLIRFYCMYLYIWR